MARGMETRRGWKLQKGGSVGSNCEVINKEGVVDGAAGR